MCIHYVLSWREQRLVKDIQFSMEEVFLAEQPTAILFAYSAKAGHNARRFGRCGSVATVLFLSIIVVIVDFRYRNSGRARKGLGTRSTSVLARLILVEAHTSAIAAALGEHPLCSGWEAHSVDGTAGALRWLWR